MRKSISTRSTTKNRKRISTIIREISLNANTVNPAQSQARVSAAVVEVKMRLLLKVDLITRRIGLKMIAVISG